MSSKSKTMKSRRKSMSISPEQKPLDHNRHNSTKKSKTKKVRFAEKKSKRKRKKSRSILHSLNSDKDFKKIMKRMELFQYK